MTYESFYNNITSYKLESPDQEQGMAYEEIKIEFWVSAVIFLCIGLVAIFGNGMVLYITHFHRNNGPLENLDLIIKSLAVADMLLGLIGIPSRITASRFEGRYFSEFL